MSYDMSFVGELRFPDEKAMKRALREISHEVCWGEAAFRKKDLDLSADRVRADVQTSAPASMWETSCFIFEIFAQHAVEGQIEATYDGGEGPDSILVETITPLTDEDPGPLDPQEAFQKAAADGDLDGVAQGVAAGLDLPLALHFGLRHVPVVKALLAAGAQAGGTVERRPLRWAAQLGYTKTVKVLLAAGADPNAHDGELLLTSPLQMAAFHGRLPAVRALLAAGADASLCPSGSAPIVLAATSRSKRAVDIVEALLAAGADPDPPAYRDKSLIAWMARDPHPDAPRIVAVLRAAASRRS